MAQASQQLKDEILTELRKDMRGPGQFTQYLNIVLLVLLGASVGFLVGRRYERNLASAMARQQPAPAQRTQPMPAATGELPPDHPPIEGAQGGGGNPMDAMAPVLELRRRVEENPEDLEALIELGNLNFQIGRYEGAIGYYQRALALDPTNPDVITDMGIAMRRLGRFDDALEAFELAASLDETHLQSRFNRGIVLMADKGDFAGAIEAFESYLALGPNVPQRAQVVQQIEALRRQLQGEARLHAPEPAEAPDAGSSGSPG